MPTIPLQRFDALEAEKIPMMNRMYYLIEQQIMNVRDFSLCRVSILSFLSFIEQRKVISPKIFLRCSELYLRYYF